MIKKIKVLMLVSLLSMTLASRADNASIIQGASYFIIHGKENSFPGIGIPYPFGYATFYDASGNEITKVPEKALGKVNFPEFEKAYSKLLDPAAPKPKVAAYAIKYWDALKGSPGYFIALSDKNGNYIKNFRVEEAGQALQHFDTQNWKESGSDPYGKVIYSQEQAINNTSGEKSIMRVTENAHAFFIHINHPEYWFCGEKDPIFVVGPHKDIIFIQGQSNSKIASFTLPQPIQERWHQNSKIEPIKLSSHKLLLVLCKERTRNSFHYWLHRKPFSYNK